MKIENEKWHVHPQYQFENVYWLFNQDDNYHEDTSMETMDKRARLMEAAPDLYRALKDLTLWAALNRNADFEGKGENHHMIKEWARAHAAIGKVERET